jgi:hypothetical protein
MVLRAEGSELAAIFESNTHAGSYAFSAVPTFGGAGELYFPLAVGPFTSPLTELVVTNQHVTATATIEITMFDGTGRVHKLYTDAQGLCPRASRTYNITELAGEIPTSGRGGGPYLSLRVNGLASGLDRSPPLAGTLRTTTSVGTAAYTGLSGVNVFTTLGGRQGLPGTPLLVVQGVKVGVGNPAVTTGLAVMSLRAGGGQAQLHADFYDKAGQLVLHDGYVRVPAYGALLDLSRGVENLAGERLRLPDAFEGVVVLRPDNPRAAVGVVAFHYPLRSGAGPRVDQAADALDAFPAQLLLRGADPDLPTATPTATRPPTGTATQPGEPTGTPTEPTPGGSVYTIRLPLALNRN